VELHLSLAFTAFPAIETVLVMAAAGGAMKA